MSLSLTLDFEALRLNIEIGKRSLGVDNKTKFPNMSVSVSRLKLTDLLSGFNIKPCKTYTYICYYNKTWNRIDVECPLHDLSMSHIYYGNHLDGTYYQMVAYHTVVLFVRWTQLIIPMNGNKCYQRARSHHVYSRDARLVFQI